MTKQDIIAEYTKLGELIAQERECGEQLIQLTLEQRKAHQLVIQQQDKVRNLEYKYEKTN